MIKKKINDPNLPPETFERGSTISALVACAARFQKEMPTLTDIAYKKFVKEIPFYYSYETIREMRKLLPSVSGGNRKETEKQVFNRITSFIPTGSSALANTVLALTEFE